MSLSHRAGCPGSGRCRHLTPSLGLPFHLGIPQALVIPPESLAGMAERVRLHSPRQPYLIGQNVYPRDRRLTRVRPQLTPSQLIHRRRLHTRKTSPEDQGLPLKPGTCSHGRRVVPE